MRKIGLFVILFVFMCGPIQLVQAKEKTFPDVLQYVDEINYLTERNIIRGYEDGTFRPTNSLTRLHAVQILLKAQGITDFTAPDPNLTDMKPTSYGYAEVAKAVELGIISGKIGADGKRYFDPSNYLTRGQMAKVVVEAAKLPKQTTTLFLDVLPTDGFHDYISTLAAERITGGYEDGTYRPANRISRQHFAVFVARMLDDRFKPSVVNKAPSFLMDTSKTYTWMYNDDGEIIETTLRKSTLAYKGAPGWDLWKEAVGGSEGYFIVTENESGLFETACRYVDEIVCEPFDDTPSPELDYPLYNGKKWTSNELVSYTVVSTNRTVTTKATTFKNVVEVKDSDGWTYFYAPKVGLVKTVDNGVTFAELVKLQ